MSTFIFILFLMLLGYLFKISKIFPENTNQVLNFFVIYVSLPAIILLEVPKIQFSSEIMIPIFIPWAMTILGALTILLLSKLFKWDKGTTGALLLVAVLGNTSFLGIPIIQYYYGNVGLPYVMIYDQIGSFLALSTYGAVVVAVYSDNGKVKFKQVLKKIFMFPPFISLIIAFSLQGIEFNEELIKVLSTLGNTLIPVALVAVGFSLQLKIPKHHISPFILGLTTKLILIPIYASILVYLFKFEGLATDISIIESGMGPMITAGAVASMAGLAPKLSASIVGYGVLLGIGTTSIIFQLLQL